MGLVVSVSPRPRFAPAKGPPVPIVQEAGWAPEPVWTQRLKEKSFASAGDRTRSFSPYSDTILTELLRLRKPKYLLEFTVVLVLKVSDTISFICYMIWKFLGDRTQ
jgi:hypothetical protein